ncbi:LysM peptidoglycan-binding domain-containing protein [Oscillatoria sp. FACHB-1407]|uniref:LysM peptidoglycan-binding domain-containing protein n=1 Tax=Oscillatoria sp. FACHB-1407 TaxID=2692847 RepID=UPI001682E75E|nr:LysM peptidoglycan-binding domain-containing protein [Oscillatoria sp. FACHB-1407]MBD2461036.1 LysM peptidoglycan-binding domain-containing protein [Oscillatoria sp. FACHB-1407]
MKRAFPQKVKPVSCDPFSVEITAGQSKQNPTGVNRKARTSAAMIGLALSMGASSLLLPRQDDGAAAAEPVAESTVAVTPLAQQVATLPGAVQADSANTIPVSSSTDVEHVVQEGQTLWQLARLYRVSVQTITAANGLTSSSTIRVGQVLTIPTSAQVSSPDLAQSWSANSEAEAKTERDQALSRLRQERDKLRNSLAELRSEESGQLSANPPKAGQQSAASPSSESVLSQRPIAEIQSQSSVVDGSNASNVVVHQVKPGETLGAIALSYGLPQQVLASANRISDPDWLRANQSLIIPQASSTSVTQPLVTVPTGQVDTMPSAAEQSGQAESAADSVVYRVNPGDTLGEIANVYNIAQVSLMDANGLQNPDLIVAGQVLRIPMPAVEQVKAPETPSVESSVEVVEPATSEEELVAAVATPAVSASDLAPTIVTEPTVVTEADANTFSDDISEPVIPEPVVAGEDNVPADEADQVAVAPLSVSPSAVVESEVSQPVNFTENLMAEILDLRDRYRAHEVDAPTQAESVAAQEPVVVAAASDLLSVPSTNITDVVVAEPEFSSSQSREAVDAQNPEVRPVVAPERSQAESEPAQSQLVAVAPLGSENYAPLVQPIAGQMVSPDLPPLPDAEAYLPNGAPRFDGFIWPAQGRLTSGYGWRWGRMHRGIDIGAPVGTPVYAVADGVVEFSGWNSGGYGNMVEIRHADGTMTRYAHHSRNLVRAGQRVEQGQHIAAVGSTGYSTGPHLHFEIHLPNQGTVNPIAYLPR